MLPRDLPTELERRCFFKCSAFLQAVTAEMCSVGLQIHSNETRGPILDHIKGRSHFTMRFFCGNNGGRESGSDMEARHVECGDWKVEEEKGLLWLVQEMRFMVSRDLSVMICERKSSSLQCYTPPAWSWATIFHKSNNSPEVKATRFTGCMWTWVEE